MLRWFSLFSFFLVTVVYILRFRSCTDLITCGSELHGCVFRMLCPMLSHIGKLQFATATAAHLKYDLIPFVILMIVMMTRKS